MFKKRITIYRSKKLDFLQVGQEPYKVNKTKNSVKIVI